VRRTRVCCVGLWPDLVLACRGLMVALLRAAVLFGLNPCVCDCVLFAWCLWARIRGWVRVRVWVV